MQSHENQTPGANDATLVSPRAQQGSARLILRRADGQLKEYGLDKDEITIGRLASNDVILPDDRSVSRRHAVIRRSNVGYVIEDQQSNNGTYVDGEKILYPFVLHNGQSIKVGSNELTFTMTSAQIKTPEQQDRAATPRGAAPEFQAPAQPSAPAQPTPPPPAFEAPPQQATFSPPIEAPAAPQFPPPPAPGGFGQPPPGPQDWPPAPQFAPPPTPEPPPWSAQPPAAPQSSPASSFQTQPASPGPASSGMVVCQSCGNPTMANKAFCLNCGAAMAPQSAPAAPAPGGPGAFGPPPGGFGQPQPGASPYQSPPGSAFGQPPPGPQGWPPQQQAQPQPGPQGWPPQQQGWPGQPAQPGPFGAPAPAPVTGPVDATVFFSKGLRPMQTSDIRVRLTTQFAGPGIQPGATITVRVWAAAQDAFFFSSPGITLRAPAPGGVEEGALQATPMRPTAPGATDQLLFMVVDAASGQPLHPAPIATEVVISYQPAPPFDGPGSLRLPL